MESVMGTLSWNGQCSIAMFDYLRLNNGIWSSAGLKHYHTKKNTSASDLVEQVQAAQPVKISLWFQTRVSSLNQWVGLTENLQDFPVFLIPLLVGGVPTILKNCFVNGRDDISYMKWKKQIMFQSPPTRRGLTGMFSQIQPVLEILWISQLVPFPRVFFMSSEKRLPYELSHGE